MTLHVLRPKTSPNGERKITVLELETHSIPVKEQQQLDNFLR